MSERHDGLFLQAFTTSRMWLAPRELGWNGGEARKVPRNGVLCLVFYRSE